MLILIPIERLVGIVDTYLALVKNYQKFKKKICSQKCDHQRQSFLDHIAKITNARFCKDAGLYHYIPTEVFGQLFSLKPA